MSYSNNLVTKFACHMIVPSVDLTTHLRQWYPTATLPGSISVHLNQDRNAAPMKGKTASTHVFSDMKCELT